MALRKGEKWICSFCKKEYSKASEADDCRDSHNLIYVAIPAEELDSLLKFLYLKNEKYLKPSVVRRLQTAMRNSRKALDKI